MVAGIIAVFILLAEMTGVKPDKIITGAEPVLVSSDTSTETDYLPEADGQDIAAELIEPPALDLSMNTDSDAAFYNVVRVIDGDTIEVEQGGVLATVRYIGIDTPEISLPNQVGECFGAEAKAENERLVVGQSVRLKRDESDTDKYGRLLRYVYQEDRFINLTLVLGGYAEAKTYSPNVAKQIALDTAETVAKAAGKGVWSKECKIRNR